MRKLLLVVMLLKLCLASAELKLPYSREFTDSKGQKLIEIIVPGLPPEKIQKQPIAKLPAKGEKGTKIIEGVPAFDWCFGCSATSMAMLASYYDRNAYNNIYTGSTNGGVMPLDNSIWGGATINGEDRSFCPLSATKQGLDGLATQGHVDRFWYKYGQTGTENFSGDPTSLYSGCTTDFMGTNQDWWSNSDGATTFYNNQGGIPLEDYSICETQSPRRRDGMHGAKLFFQSRGYTVTTNYNQYIVEQSSTSGQGFSFANYKTEIDNNHPVLIQVAGHTMLGVGYNEVGNIVYLHDTWDYSTHEMTWGGIYSSMQHYGVGVIHLEPIVTNPPVADFSASSTSTAAGQTITFTDLSTNSPTSWNWAISPSTGVSFVNSTTSTSHNPVVQFDNTGNYTVTLTVSNNVGPDSEIKTNFINIYPAGETVTYFSENFDGSWTTPSTLQNNSAPWSGTGSTATEWHRNDYLTGWTLGSNGTSVTTGANSTAKYARFHSYFIQASAGEINIVTPVIDFLGNTSKTLEFYYANLSGDDILKVYLSTDGGASWSPALQTFTTSTGWSKKTVNLGSVTSNQAKIKFGATSDYGDDDISLDEVKITAILPSAINQNMPKSTALYQNYPNPFNPLTSIKFDLAQAGKTELNIYNAKGELVRQLVSCNLQAKSHTVSFNAAELNSGLYFYRLTTLGTTFTKKMLLVK